MRKMSKIIPAVLLAAAVSLAAAGCGSGSDASKIAESASAEDSSGYGNTAEESTVTPGTDQVSAAQIPIGEKLTEEISGGNADSWFCFTTGSRGTYTVTAVSLGSSEEEDVTIRLCDTAGNDLDRVYAQHFGAPETIMTEDLDNDSTYYIDVTGRQGAAYVLYLTSPDADYDPAEDLREASAEEESVDAAGNAAEAVLVPAGHEFTQIIGESLNDWYAFRTGSQSAVYTISVSSSPSDDSIPSSSNTSSSGNISSADDEITLHILDKYGNVIESVNTRGEDGSLTAGITDFEQNTVYFIAVSGDPNTEYSLLVSEDE